METIGFVIVNDPPPPPPRPIEGSVGSRIRLIFGDTGSDWLLLLNEDDGDTEWQTHDFSSIPYKVENQINNCVNKGHYVQEVDFGPMGGWYMYCIQWDNTGGHAWWGWIEAALEIRKYQPIRIKYRSHLVPTVMAAKHMLCYIRWMLCSQVTWMINC